MIAVQHSVHRRPDDFTTSDDAVEMGTQAATHWDTLSHVGYDGLLYNGIPDDAIDERGAAKLGIEHFGPVVTRGVLLDIARLHGVDHFEPGYAIGRRRSRRGGGACRRARSSRATS